MGIGIATFALLTFFLLRFVENRLSDHEYGQFAAFWSLLMGFVIGFTYPLESFGLGLKNRSLTDEEKDMEELSAIKTAVTPIAYVLVLFSPLYVSKAFDGLWVYVLLLISCLGSFALIYTSRARFLNKNLYNRYAGLLGFEGTLRLVFAVLLLSLASPSGANAALAITAAAFFAAFTGARLSTLQLRNILKLKLPKRTSIQKLILANIATITILNIGPFMIKILQSDGALPGKELNSLTIARIPIFLGPIIQSFLIPRIQSHKNANQKENFLPSFALMSSFVYLIGVVIFGKYGRTVVKIIYGEESTALGTNYFLISITTALYLLFITVQSHFIAVDNTKPLGSAALIGLFAFSIAMLLPLEILTRTEIASATAFLFALAYLGRGYILRKIKGSPFLFQMNRS